MVIDFYDISNIYFSQEGSIVKLKEYLSKYKLGVKAFSRITGICERTLYGYLFEEKTPSLQCAIIIVTTTNFKVDYIDLVPRTHRKKISRNYGPDTYKNLL